ncbi:hypothetical protein QTN47_11660 [Danxiaibacter flavus]|uniref:Uncharacterized protein n=1 Tax=Danxiaibacter flavus TaxID=3049108 RepID=A0ABV3ZE51_9BACT|nr:hypothetical protein QNM32_11665 [Chitinophagaceae bacterium DXS]
MSTIKDFVYHLRRAGFRVNFIEANQKPDVDEPFTDDPDIFFENILPRDGQYDFVKAKSQYTVFPSDSMWRKEISGIHIKNTPRINAVEEYLSFIQKYHIHIQPPAIKGDPDSPDYTDTITLANTGQLKDHLLQLLGTDRSLVFTIEKTQTGLPMLHFERIG